MAKVLKWKRREALEFCCYPAETEWRSCKILLLEKLLGALFEVKWTTSNYQELP